VRTGSPMIPVGRRGETQFASGPEAAAELIEAESSQFTRSPTGST
jgi:hypothetical protein